jgi:hypothetical protein
MSRRGDRSRFSALLPLVIAACGCGYRHSKPVVEFGKNFPCRSVIRLEGEPTPAEVVAMIGPPLERRPTEGGETFRYSVRGRYGDRVKLLGVVTVSEPHYYWSCDVKLEFRDGRLYAITHTVDNSGPDGSEKDGPTTRLVRPVKAAN